MQNPGCGWSISWALLLRGGGGADSVQGSPSQPLLPDDFLLAFSNSRTNGGGLSILLETPSGFALEERSLAPSAVLRRQAARSLARSLSPPPGLFQLLCRWHSFLAPKRDEELPPGPRIGRLPSPLTYVSPPLQWEIPEGSPAPAAASLGTALALSPPFGGTTPARIGHAPRPSGPSASLFWQPGARCGGRMGGVFSSCE